MHGIGNDYVYVNGFAETVAEPAPVESVPEATAPVQTPERPAPPAARCSTSTAPTSGPSRYLDRGGSILTAGWFLARLAVWGIAGELLAETSRFVFRAEANLKSEGSRGRHNLEDGRLDFLAVEPQSDRIHCCAERLTSGRFNTYDKRICSRQWARS